ncbi:hypothetical protein [Flavobacterium difficile]|uniref:Lipoprotein n=1 Tax=Flavobacterium difficile TaxID=2709659 RepID=A0ABX0I4Y5_9FLAO|nr:hypothetical protein [Flavobacterium difficile]NHM00854.1 hypothetical protein [Flavobacterium difficile]
MKLFKLTLGCFLLFMVTSCVTSLPINQQFYNTKKVGVILQVDEIGMAKAGGQGLLDMALTPGNKFTEPLKSIEPKLKLNEKIKAEITSILKSKNKEFVFIDQKFDYQTLEKFDKPKSDKKFNKKDFRKFKTTNNVDEILYVKVKHGILVTYQGVIEINKQGYVSIGTEIIDLTDNSLLLQDNFQTAAKIDGNWKKGEDFSNLSYSIQNAINSSITILKTKF